MKKDAAIFLLFPLTVLLAVPFFASAEAMKTGNHTGEERFLEYSIEYLDPQGVTTVDSLGIWFKPFYYGWSFLPTIVPEKYFDNYPLYFSGDILNFRVRLKNTGKRVFENIKIIAIQERLNPSGLKGADIGDQNTSKWFVERLGPGEIITLNGSFAIPYSGESGLDQTHLQIMHWPNEDFTREVGPGRIIIDDFQAGIWCPTA
ncbi:MAG: hypothetical protein A2934_00595 [Candidatus Sungbacteria bacterium RIFCSPLOWO2_01_FULL_47_10]|uniref:DUF11 domain-containing protein n=1 Tax=Candidatus Sungbacteria bacterium RIFCSPLOWO2_01_FULL_47_10 TaxID=1802276 RepID=A0A1G2L5A4_9BACT|nr:MAG: hypothetical protein A2934_00595 [Candidatus Sungbacteria bacterium RIFCSPLOWO2_01_FULL_47_10]